MKLTLCIFCIYLLISLSSLAKPKKSKYKKKSVPAATGILSQYVSIRDYPFMVGLVMLYERHPRHYCAASIIAEYFAVTTAHCLYPESIQRAIYLGAIVVRGGETNIQGSRGYDHRIYGFTIHPEFDPSKRSNDIAVIQVKDQFNNMFEAPIKYPISNQNQRSTKLPLQKIKIFAWRKFELGGIPSKWLMYTKAKIVLCPWPIIWTHPESFCAIANGIDECVSATGGAAIFENSLIGMVSWGRPCESDMTTTVYIKIGHYSTWIDQTLNNISNIIDK